MPYPNRVPALCQLEAQGGEDLLRETVPAEELGLTSALLEVWLRAQPLPGLVDRDGPSISIDVCHQERSIAGEDVADALARVAAATRTRFLGYLRQRWVTALGRKVRGW